MTMSGVKKKRVSKKSKLSWRKHVDINDVEEFLEDKRLEERLGAPLETFTNDQLFVLDTKPSEELLSSKERKQLKLLQPPKCFSILQSYTNVPDPIKKRNRVRSKEERKDELIKKKEAENRSKGILKYRERQAIHDRKVNEHKKKTQHKRGEYIQNIWDEEEKLEIERNSWFNKNTIKHNLTGTGKSRKTVKSPKRPKTTILPSIELPHPGMSYNPSFNDHQDLLKIVAEQETKMIKNEEHLNRVTTNMFCKVPAAERDASWLEEMSEGLPHKENQTENFENVSDDDYKAINPPVKNAKKTMQQRRKQREQRQLALQRKIVKLEKRKISDIHQLKRLKTQIDKKEIKENMLREKRKKIQLLKKKEPKRLSSTKFQETELEFNMGPDISGNLRNIKKEGNLLSDRFRSLQKRNIIEPTIKRHRKKAKVKIYTKPGHKDDWKKTVARSDINPIQQKGKK